MSERFFAWFERMFVLWCLASVTAIAATASDDPGRGPVILRAVLPAMLDGPWQPLLAAGEPGAGDVVFCRRLADGRVVFGWEQTGHPACLSDPITAPGADAQEILISLGSLLPGKGDPIYEKEPALALLRDLALIQFRGRTVLMAKGQFTPTKDRVLGRNSVGGDLARPFFSGNVDLEASVDIHAALAAAVAPGRLIAEDLPVASEAREYPGPLRLKLMFPGGGAGHNEPLVVTGVTRAGDFIYVRYEDDQHLRIGFDHWLVGGPVSEPLTCDVTVPHEVVVSMGSLLPPPNPERPDSPEVAELRQRCIVLLDGKRVISTPAKFYPTKPEQITLFTNTLGGSTAALLFTGAISRVERVPPAEILRAAP